MEEEYEGSLKAVHDLSPASFWQWNCGSWTSPWFKGGAVSSDLGSIAQTVNEVLVARTAIEDCIRGRESGGNEWFHN